ncbi:hypothetical protein LINPERHAP2_LOCUS11967 [Linum perenne]
MLKPRGVAGWILRIFSNSTRLC